MQSDDFIPLVRDAKFKKLMNEHNELLNMFTRQILFDEKLIGVPYLINTEFYPFDKNDRSKFGDLVYTFKNNVFVQIELNGFKKEDTKRRNFSYLVRLYIDKKGVEDGTKKFYLINLNNFKDEGYDEFNFVFGKNSCKKFVENFTIVNISIEKYYNDYYNGIRDDKTRLIAMLRSKNVEEFEQIVDGLLSKKLKEGIINMISKYDNNVYKVGDEDKSTFFDAISITREEGIEEGIEIGVDRNCQIVIENMIKEGFQSEMISKIINKPLSYIENIKKEFK